MERTAEAETEQIIATELARLRWDEAELRAPPGGHARKVALAGSLRAETTRTAGWIAERVGIGIRSCLYHGRKVVKIKNRPFHGYG